jgi:hypothetical protein
MGAYVESFTLVLEEHVWLSLAIACSHRRAAHTQRNYAERGCRTTGAVCERHGRKMGVGRGGDGNAADWSSLGDAGGAEMTVAAGRQNLGRTPLAPPRLITRRRQAITISPTPTSLQSLDNMADATKYYELYRRSRYYMRFLGSDSERAG